MAFKLPDLPYAYDALQPHLDKRTMKIHHERHHAGYTNKLNAAVEGTPLEKLKIEDILKDISKYPTAVRNNGGGFYNHSLFWKVMGPDAGGQPGTRNKFGKAFAASFKSYEDFTEQFKAAATSRFGSGWAWLCVNKRTGKLFVTSTPNQDNPLMDVADKKGTPVLGLDVWEHAYYLKYQNKRGSYIDAFFNVVNWDVVSKLYNAAVKPATKRKAAPRKKAADAKK
ncbi:MAG: superoxide dismutase [Bacteroidota bacterium]